MVAEMAVIPRLAVQEHQVKEMQVERVLLLLAAIMLLEAVVELVQQVATLILMVVQEALV